MAALEMRSCWGCKYHKVYDDFQVKGFRLCLFFRCALVISNPSDCSTVLVVLRGVLNLLFPSYALWGCRTSRGGDCFQCWISLKSLSWLLTRRVTWSFGQQVCWDQVFCWSWDATLEHVGPLQNLLLSKHGLLDVGNVHVAHHKNLKQRR